MEFTAYASSSKGNLYAIRGGRSPLLIDFGIGLNESRKLLDFQLSDACGCLISHSHMDHAKSLPGLLRRGVDVYASFDTLQAFGSANHHRAHVLPDNSRPVVIGDYAVKTFATIHDCKGSRGFYVAHGQDRLLLAVDTFYVRERFAGLTHVCVECNYSQDTMRPDLPAAQKNRLMTSHFSLENVLTFLQSNDLSQVREIHLLHLSAGNSDEEIFRREVMRATGKPVYVAPERIAA